MIFIIYALEVASCLSEKKNCSIFGKKDFKNFEIINFKKVLEVSRKRKDGFALKTLQTLTALVMEIGLEKNKKYFFHHFYFFI